jgi:hypothetical protein
LHKNIIGKGYKVKIIDPVKDTRWDTFVSGHKYSTVYHHSVWKELLQKTFNHMTALYFILEDNENKIVGGVPIFFVKSWLTGNRFVSLPFASTCIPLCSNLNDFEILVRAISEKLKAYNCSYFEMRMRNDSQFLNSSMFKRICNSKSHVLPLDKDLDTLRKSFHKTSILQRINRALRDGLVARLAVSENDMKSFYKLLTLQRVKKFGLLPHPYRLFRNMWELLYQRNMLDLYIIEYHGKMIAGMLVLKYHDTAISEHAAADTQYLKHGTYQLLWWKAIESSNQQGFRFFDMGKSGIDDIGLIEFKRRWKPKEYEVYHLYLPEARGVYSESHTSMKRELLSFVLRHSPLPLTTLAGSFVYKHMG